MGAQTEERLAQYKKRYKDWEDPNGEERLLPWLLIAVSEVSSLVPWRPRVRLQLQVLTCTCAQQKRSSPAVCHLSDVCSWQDTVSNNAWSQNDTFISYVAFNFI